MVFKRIAYISTAATVPATEAFVTLNLVNASVSGSGTTATKVGGRSALNGGILQVWNESAARDTTVKLYYSMKEDPGTLASGDWIEYDSVTVSANDGTSDGTDSILWGRPYKYLAVTASAAASTASSLVLELHTY